MEKDDNLNKLDALKRRRELLATLAARRRLNLRSSTPKQCEEGKTLITTNAHSKQVSSSLSNSSDVIEDSDIENDHENSKQPSVFNSSGDSNSSCNTSTFCLPLGHAFFRSPHKLDENTSLQPTKSERKIRILSEVIIKPPVSNVSSSISPARSYIPHHAPFNRSPIGDMLKTEIEMIPDTQHLQRVSLPTACDNVPVETTPEIEMLLDSPHPQRVSLPTACDNVPVETTPEIEMLHDSPHPQRVSLPTACDNVPVETTPEIEMLLDSPHPQRVSLSTACDNIRVETTPETKKCVLETTSQDQTITSEQATNIVTNLPLEIKQATLKAEPKHTQLHSAKVMSHVNIDLYPQITIQTIKECSSPTADNIAPINTSPDVQNISANTLNLDTDIDDQRNSPSIMDEMSILNVNQHPVALSPLPNDYFAVDEPVPGPSSDIYRTCSGIEDTQKIRKRHFRPTVNKAYLDYLSEEEQKDFSAGSSDLWSNDETDISSDGTKKKKIKKKTKKIKKNDETISDKEAVTLLKKKEKRSNVNKLRKVKRDEGKAYETKAGVVVEEKKMKENPCLDGKCPNRCFEITEERRNSLFNHFWKLDSQRRRDCILRCIRRIPVKRKRTSNPQSRRTATHEHFINDGEDHRKVCQKFLIHTLDITQKYITYTIQNSEEGMAKQDMRKPNVQPKYSEAIKENVAEFIKKLPVLPSHYNRPKTDKMYLPQEYKSTVHIYRKYLEDCKINGYQPVSETIFRQIFNEYNISIHVPKKDKCQICTRFENSKDMVTTNNKELPKDEKFEAHLNEKNATYRRFKSQQNSHLSNDTITTSFDLQKVLNTPYGESMLLYYSRKYAVYNLTFYESGTQDVFCFTWGESDAKRGSNEIATCLLKYLKNIDSRGVRNLLLYCDSCTGQNKNKTVLAVLNWFLKTSNNLEVIQINYLLPGHTYMPVDSVHAVIEREVKRLIVWSPSQWPAYFQSARKYPRPYQVEVLDHTDFLDFEELAERTFTPSVLKKVRIQQIRTATFKKKDPDQIRLKYSMIEDSEETRVTLQEGRPKANNAKGKGKGSVKSNGKGKGKGKGKGNAKTKTVNAQVTIDDSRQDIPGPLIKPAYIAKLPISKAKYKDLMRLCDNGTIPKTYHKEYSQIPCEDTVCDYFPHSDYGEDDESNED